MIKLLIVLLEQLRSILYQFMVKIKIPENWAEKPSSPFCLFVRDSARVVHVEYPWSPYYKSTLRFLISEYLLQVTNFINFSKYSHIEKYNTQDHGAGRGL